MKISKKSKVVLQLKDTVRPELPKTHFKRYQWRMVENKRSWRMELFLKDFKKFSKKIGQFFSKLFKKKS